jgi:hypothetical protein
MASEAIRIKKQWLVSSFDAFFFSLFFFFAKFFFVRSSFHQNRCFVARPPHLSHRASSAPSTCSSNSNSTREPIHPSAFKHRHSVSTGGTPLRISSTSGSTVTTTTNPQSTFKHALMDIPLPRAVMEGVSVVHVFANGKAEPCTLRLSDDKFTLHVESTSNNSNGSGWFKKKPERIHLKIDIGSIHSIQRGRTQRFEKLAR